MRIPTPISGVDHRSAAAAIFNVLPEDVTPAMIARCRTVTFAVRHAQTFVSTRAETPTETVVEHWPDCPTCKQSATGKYFNGIHGCTRCGWSAGGEKGRGGAFQ